MKDEIKVLLVLAALLLLLESGARVFETRLSKDVQHLRELPQQAALLKAAPQKALKVLVLGNSLARCGIDLPLLAAGLRQQSNRDVVIAVMHPDGSRIEEWTYGYRRYFQQAGAVPDVILATTGLRHLIDQVQNLNGMGAYYVSGADLGEFCSNRLTSVEEGARFFGARFSGLWAHRDRVEPLVFYNLVPGYTDTAQNINRGAVAGHPTSGMPFHHESCDVFGYLAQGLQATRTRLLLVTVPMPQPYDLPGAVRKQVQSSGVTLLDFGATMQLPKERFPDGYHLDAQGAALLTRQILAHWPATP